MYCVNLARTTASCSQLQRIFARGAGIESTWSDTFNNIADIHVSLFGRMNLDAGQVSPAWLIKLQHHLLVLLAVWSGPIAVEDASPGEDLEAWMAYTKKPVFQHIRNEVGAEKTDLGDRARQLIREMLGLREDESRVRLSA